jgi:hypothetical protein
VYQSTGLLIYVKVKGKYREGRTDEVVSIKYGISAYFDGLSSD